MRSVKVKVFWGPGVQRQTWTLSGVFAYFERDALFVPPLPVLNEFFQNGTGHDETGAYEWKPFTITPEEYEEMYLEILTRPNSPYRAVDVPEWVQTKEQWKDWKSAWLRDEQREDTTG